MQTAWSVLSAYPCETQAARGGPFRACLLPARVYMRPVPGSCTLGPGSDSALGTGRRNGYGRSVDSLRT